MSTRLHVESKHIVEYSDFSAFKYNIVEFQQLLMCLEVELTCELGDHTFEVSSYEFDNAIYLLENHKMDNDKEYVTIVNKIYNNDSSISDKTDILVAIFNNYKKCADTNDGYLHFEYF